MNSNATINFMKYFPSIELLTERTTHYGIIPKYDITELI